MKILYGIQGTGHGHISRAREILPLLTEYAEVDVLMSGYNCKMELFGFRVIRKSGISFDYDKNGSISICKTVKRLKPAAFIRDISSLQTGRYDLVVSDFEPVSAWAATLSGCPCVGMSHQASFLSDKSPRPDRKSLFPEQILRRFAPCTVPFGFHFRRYDLFIEPPVIRSEVLGLSPAQGNHITVYLPAYDHNILAAVLKPLKSIRWEVFSPFCDYPVKAGHIHIQPVDNRLFLKSLETCYGVITSAGFETCAESMYLGKKLMVLPIGNQYEQSCNAAALKQMGVPVLQSLNGTFQQRVRDWIEQSPRIALPEIADTRAVTEKLLGHAG